MEWGNTKRCLGSGAFHRKDVSQEFITKNAVWVGWSRKDAPSLFEELRQMSAGDIVCVKSFTPQSGLTIKAVGIAAGGLGDSGKVMVSWLSQETKKVGKVKEKPNIRSNTLYREYNPRVFKEVIDAIVGGVESS